MSTPRRKTPTGAAIVCFVIAVSALLPASLPPSWVAPERALGKSGCPNTAARPARISVAGMSRSVLCLVNAARRRHGLSRLRVSADLRRAATGHSLSMVRRDFFSHYGPAGDPGDRIRRTGYFRGASRWSWGENIAAGQSRKGSPRWIVRAWMLSPGHRANILSGQFREIGVGVARGYPDTGNRNSAPYTIDLGLRRR